MRPHLLRRRFERGTIETVAVGCRGRCLAPGFARQSQEAVV